MGARSLISVPISTDCVGMRSPTPNSPIDEDTAAEDARIAAARLKLPVTEELAAEAARNGMPLASVPWADEAPTKDDWMEVLRLRRAAGEAEPVACPCMVSALLSTPAAAEVAREAASIGMVSPTEAAGLTPTVAATHGSDAERVNAPAFSEAIALLRVAKATPQPVAPVFLTAVVRFV
jgi:hypothetical protein